MIEYLGPNPLVISGLGEQCGQYQILAALRYTTVLPDASIADTARSVNSCSEGRTFGSGARLPAPVGRHASGTHLPPSSPPQKHVFSPVTTHLQADAFTRAPRYALIVKRSFPAWKADER